MMMLASKDEPKEDVSKYQEALKVPKHVKTFEDQVNGFMSARGDLKDDKSKAEYERGYELALEFFHDYLVWAIPFVTEEGTKADVGWIAKDISAISKLCRAPSAK